MKGEDAYLEWCVLGAVMYDVMRLKIKNLSESVTWGCQAKLAMSNLGLWFSTFLPIRHEDPKVLRGRFGGI